MTAIGSVALLDDGQALSVMLDGTPYRFHAIWLRDNALDPATRSAVNGQRLITLHDIPADARIGAADCDANGLHVRFAPDGHCATYPAQWLRDHAYDKPAPDDVGWTGAHITRWDAHLADAPAADWHALQTDPHMLLDWLQRIRRYGFARLHSAPITSGVPEQIVALFGHVRETNYGRVFDIRAEVNPANLAYTNLDLQAHTDNPYRDPVPGLQVLACLHNDVEGGLSTVVDGFAVAARLKAWSPEYLALLSGYNARFDYAGAPDVRLQSHRPLIELGPDGELRAVRFNNRSAAPFTDVPYDRMPAYYRAYRRMAECIDDPALAVQFRLQPGEAFVVDNRRVLHARTAFSGSGQRHLQGCYAEADGLLSRIAVLERNLGGDLP